MKHWCLTLDQDSSPRGPTETHHEAIEVHDETIEEYHGNREAYHENTEARPWTISATVEAIPGWGGGFLWSLHGATPEDIRGLPEEVEAHSGAVEAQIGARENYLDL